MNFYKGGNFTGTGIITLKVGNARFIANERYLKLQFLPLTV